MILAKIRPLGHLCFQAKKPLSQSVIVGVRDFPQDPVAPSLMGRRTDDIVVPSSQSIPQVVFVILVCVLELGKGQVLVLGTFRVPWVRDGSRRWRKRSLGLFTHDCQDGRGFDVCSSLCSGSLCITTSISSGTKRGVSTCPYIFIRNVKLASQS